VITTPDAAFAAPVSPWRRIVRVVSMVRYRFFLYAGLLPYLLGATWAYAIAGRFDTPVFWTGLSGVILAVIGVEAFNEYFDARMGTDLGRHLLDRRHRVRRRACGRRLSHPAGRSVDSGVRAAGRFGGDLL